MRRLIRASVLRPVNDLFSGEVHERDRTPLNSQFLETTMKRRVMPVLTSLLVAAVAGIGSGNVEDQRAAADLSDRVLEGREVDCGIVPRGIEVRSTIKVTNPFKTPLHIAAFSSEFGKVRPTLADDLRWIKPGKSINVPVSIETRKLYWDQSLRLRIDFDQPQLGFATVDCIFYVRTDLICDASKLDFGSVTGGAPSRSLKLKYSGRGDWKLDSASCANKAISLSLHETRRWREEPTDKAMRVDYELTATLAKNAPAGAIDDEIFVMLNDGRMKKFRVAIVGTKVDPE